MIKRGLITLKNNKYYITAIKRNFAKIFRKKPLINCLIIYCLILIILLGYKYSLHSGINKFYSFKGDSELLEVTSAEVHNLTITEYLGMRKLWKTSNLGSFLFKNINNSFHQKDKTFVVLVWKYWDWLKARHVNNYRPDKSGDESELLKDCSVNNCVFTGNDKTMNTSDAVVVHIMHGQYPKVKYRNTNQIWILLNDEAPMNAFNMAKTKVDLESWANVFNWSMTYKSNADVPVPYGRTVPLIEPLKERVTYEDVAEMIPNLQFKRTDVLVAVLISNCKVAYRIQFLEILQKYINIDIYGNCGHDEKKYLCQGHFKRDCPLLDQYYFYLVMENSMCKQYITEKTFHNGYAKGAIPILVGSLSSDAEKILPPNSYIHSNDYSSIKKLAEKINGTIQNVREYLSYHLWRNHFEVRNEHGYFGTKSYHMCRLCEALNYNEEKKKIYNIFDLKKILDPYQLCRNLNAFSFKDE